MRRERSSLHHELHGASGPALLLIPGFGMGARAWTRQVEGLSATHRVLVYDPRGIGRSPRSERAPTLTRMVDDALAVVDDVGWQSAHVVGHSLGGVVAQQLALDCPARVQSLALIATDAGGRLRWSRNPAALPLLLRLIRGPAIARREGYLRAFFPPEWLSSLPAAERARLDELCLRFASDTAAVPTSWLAAQARAGLRGDNVRRLAGLTMPVLIVRPGRDRLVGPTENDRLHAAIPQSRLLALDDAGHGVMVQRDRTLNEALAQHVG
jgi:pimeloyl-ACP methyl ester carboxylesterase